MMAQASLISVSPLSPPPPTSPHPRPHPSALGSITKPNPRNPQWGTMKLLLKKQVMAVALKKHGSLARVQEERLARSVKRFDGGGGKGGGGSGGGGGGGAAAKRAKTQAPLGPRPVREPPHQHVFPADAEVYDPATDLWSNACTVCGHRTEYEKM
jgi:hypothetical protein